jgi:carboxyl-terminal processing protease
VVLGHRALAIVFSLALAAASLSPPVYSQEATGLEGVRAEYNDLLDLFYRPLEPHDLLQAGWTALRSDAERRSAVAPGPLPELPADRDAAFDVLADAYYAYVGGSAGGLSADARAALATGMAESVHEQHTHYLPQATMQRFLATVGGGQQAIGLGVRLSADPPGLIVAVAPEGPAARAGLQPGDVILNADGRDLANADTPTLSSALTGPQGSVVNLSIDRGNGPQPIVVTRGPYYFPPLESRVLQEGVGYLRLSDFVISGTSLPNGTEVLADLDRRLDELDAYNVQGLILDLRGNGGGSVQTADSILGRFLPETARSVHEFDQRGHEAYDLASGRLHPRQVPMAVLINAGSASASEVTAAALRDAHRAVLVGQRTAGAVAASELLPLPGGGGLQIAVAAARAPESGADLDGVGVTPDITVADTRTLADYRSGRDPQLEAAVQALAQAPSPPVASVSVAALTSAELDQLLEPVLPASGAIPTNDRLRVSNRWQRLDFMHPNELIDQNGGAPDPVALQQALRSRGYEGSVLASYGATPGDLPTVSVDVDADLYATVEGAHTAVSTNDVTQLLVRVETPLQAGDETVAYNGTWLATGSTVIAWRRGRLVLTVTYSDIPGYARPETLVAISQLVDTQASQLTLP